jgi:hypothetical protein
MLSEFLPAEIFFFIWLSGLTFFLVKTLRHYQRLTQGVEKKDLKSLLEEILKRINQKEDETKELFKLTQGLEKEGLRHIQKMGFMRYNPFGDTGGDQSFILTLLDGKDNGVVISSFHGREGTRIYAKSIRAGKGEHFALSEEEEKIIKEARLKR